jgi:hypothetical protein
MTLEKVIDQARTFSRTSTTTFTSGMDNAKAMEFVNEAMIQFAKDIPRLSKSAFLTVAPRFSLSPILAIRITIVGGTNALAATDVALTDSTTELTGQTGTQVATELQAQIRAAGPTTLTVTWSTTDWVFKIDTVDGTSITIESPDSFAYGDGTEILGISGTTNDHEVTGEMPEDCTLDVDLPSDFLTLPENPRWDDVELMPMPYREMVSPETFGTPTGYGIDVKKMRLYPSPTRQGALRIRYKYWPTKFVTV